MRSATMLGLALVMFCSFARAESYSPYPSRSYATNLYWGDTHVHSSWSTDAGSSGNERLAPDDAFRFARGDTVTAHNGQQIRLHRPLDFLLVSDHSEYLGLYPMLEEANPDFLATENGKRWHALLQEGRRARIGGEFGSRLHMVRTSLRELPFTRTMWDRVIANAERFNDPGRFTAFIGYEWTSMPGGANLHRNVLFRDGAARVSQVLPFSSMDSFDPEDLWKYLADYEERTGGAVLAIPHNSNMSAGRMFEPTRIDGSPMSKAYAQERTRWEPVVEATQIKGDSEAAPFLSPDDEFADYGTWDQTGGAGVGPHEDAMYAGEYVRPALGNGLALDRELGGNPFAFGLIGSTDSHTSLATADDADFWGKFSRNEPRPGRAAEPWVALEFPEGSAGASINAIQLPSQMYTWALVASGYAAVWAHENTRASLFDAMRRRETYATTGPRMVVRFFGGFGYTPEDAHAPDVAAVGHAKGVPMGGELARAPKGAAPSFLVSALRDPEGANLDRVQIIKQWLDAEGKLHERIFDVAVSDGRAIGPDGRCPTPVGSTVDASTATYSNSIGAVQLSAVWRDPDFDPQRRAVYYVRVLEIPTPRWTTYDAVRFGESPHAAAPVTTQERAYTSPIWYSP